VCALPPKSQNGGLKNRHRHRCRHQEKWENATLAGVGKAAAGKAAAAAKQKAANEISGQGFSNSAQATRRCRWILDVAIAHECVSSLRGCA